MGGRRGEYVFFWNPIVNSSAAKIFENLRTNSVSHLNLFIFFLLFTLLLFLERIVLGKI